jgi:PTH1 family peptidyl-tRNA hydrolase
MSLSSAPGPLLVIGLGNPGKDYRLHRHNVGFMLADRLAADLGLRFTRRKAKAWVASGGLSGRKLILAKPQTYMNLAGHSVAALVRFYRIDLPALLVICDDLDLARGVLRLRPEGGSAGHRGLRSIFVALGSQDFPRLRIGIGRPPGSMDPADFVLQGFSDEERPIMESAFDRGLESIRLFASEGIQAAMTRFNGPAD